MRSESRRQVKIVDKLVYSYALIKALHDQGKDYLDVFWPFVIRSLSEHSATSLSNIKSCLQSEFNIEIPLHVTEAILNRAIDKEYVQKISFKKEYVLTQSGIDYSDMLETEKEVERRSNALIEDIKEFFEKEKLPLGFNQIKQIFITFLQKNLSQIVDFFNPSKDRSCEKKTLNKNERLLVEYITIAEKNRPSHFETLQDIIFGSIISVVLCVNSPEKITGIREKKFRKCKIFLDSNFVFSIFGMHPPEFSKPARELFFLLKRYNLDIRVFDFTVNEICNVLSIYLQIEYKYPVTIPVDSIIGVLKQKGWKKTDVEEFISSIERKMQEEDINIEVTDITLIYEKD